MAFNLIPRDEGFYDLFDEMGDLLIRTGDAFFEMMSRFDRVEERARQLKDLEHTADGITRRIYEALDRSFLTPLEPEDIHRLAGTLDDVADELEETAFRFSVYLRDEKPTPASVKMADLIQKSCVQVGCAVKLLRNKVKSDDIQVCLRELGLLENKGDELFRELAAALFAHPSDPLSVIKWKDLYERLEGTLDYCRDVGNVITEIVLKSS